MTGPTFVEFMVAATGFEPFPWQNRLANKFAASDPVDQLDIPTGAGKSSIIEAHLWAAAVNPDHPRRLFVTVDRRVLVTQIGEQASRLQRILGDAIDGPLFEIGLLLHERGACLSVDDFDAGRLDPFDVHSLRGGQAASNDWVTRPDRVAVISSTPDQVGSSMLHRGYLLKPNIRPLGAAMFCDSIVAVDEAHLSPALLNAVGSIGPRWGGDTDANWGRPPRLISMSATHANPGGRTVSLNADDLKHPVLSTRLEAPRWLSSAASEKNQNDAIVTQVIERMGVESKDSRCALVVVNTVADAIAVYKKLTKKLTKNGIVTVRITGRQNSVQRDAALKMLTPFLSGGDRSHSTDTVVVATQSIECGIDLDADFCVTAACPWSNLIQRIGRTNRVGSRSEACNVVVWKLVAEPKPDDRVGPYLWLDVEAALLSVDERCGLNDRCDLSYSAMAHQTAAGILVPVPPAADPLAHVTDEFVDLWSSNVADLACPDPAVFIRGTQDDDLDVLVAARAGLVGFEEGIAGDHWGNLLDLLPVTRDELIPVGVADFRKFAEGKKATPGVPVMVSSFDEGWQICSDPNSIKPGSIVAIPTSRGGADEWGWTGEARLVDASTVANSTADPSAAPTLDEQYIDADGYVTVRTSGPIDGWTVTTVIQDSVEEVHTLTFPAVVAPVRFGDLPIGRLALDVHHADVADLAGSIGRSLGLPSEIVASVVAAAGSHDTGKLDTRFQLWLDPNMSGSDSTPLAKGEPVSFWELRRSRAIAGVPQRWRHEAATACNLTDLPLLDDRLVNWLIHTHHGHGRPFWPHCDDPSVPLQTTFDPDWVDIRDDLTAKYGPWRLSLLESVVRCADWVGSQQRSEQSATAPKETT